MSINPQPGDKVVYILRRGPMATKERGTYVGPINECDRKDCTAHVVLNDMGNAQRVYSIVRIIARNPDSAVQKSETKKERPDNKATEVKAFETTDGQLHPTKKEAEQHQVKLDFYEWGDGVVHPALRISRGKLLEFMRDNKKDLTAFLRRIK